MADSGWSVAAANVARKAWRRALAVPPRLRQRARRAAKAAEQIASYRAERRIEREIGQLTRGAGPIIVGPWLSEVGYEVLYWVPFVRWVQKQYDVDSSRFVIVTRGGAAAWYGDMAAASTEVFDLLPPDQFAARNAARAAGNTGTLKQFGDSELDREIVGRVRQQLGDTRARVLHPSLMYRLFHQFWLGHRPAEFYDRHARPARIDLRGVAVPDGLPSRFVAMKLYTATSLPPTPAIARTLRSLVAAVAARTPVVLLETGVAFDDHGEHAFDAISGVTSLRGRLPMRDNLATQAAVIARADSFVGTCGALAWLAPLLGVDTTAVMAEPAFLHQHLQVARRAYQRIEGAGRFSVLDIGAFEQLGLGPELRFATEPTA